MSNGTRREINNKDYFNEISLRPIANDSLLYYTSKIPSEPIANFTFRNNQDLTFSDVSEVWGLDDKNFSNGAVYADLDNDGDLEIIVNNIDQEAQIYKNNSDNNFIKIKLIGDSLNPNGIGSRVFVNSGELSQMQELTLTRGFQSSVSPTLNFGLGKNDEIDQVKVIWPNGQEEIINNINVNTLVELKIENSVNPDFNSDDIDTFFENVDLLKYKHEENDYNDFVKEVLLPHENSRLGPGIATGDLDGNSFEDFVVGGANGQPTAFFYQNPDGSFEKKQFSFSEEHSKYEDMDMILEDFDNDGDLDLYIVSGGNEFEPDTPILKDRLYVNIGQGILKYSDSSLPNNYSSGMRVSSADFDNDGDLDLFVGGRVVPGMYPVPAKSYLLVNQSNNKEIIFTNATNEEFSNNDLGLITSSVWTDYNNDNWIDLIVVGEWTPIMFFKNMDGKLVEDKSLIDEDSTRGWWYDITSEDFDNCLLYTSPSPRDPT